MEFIGKACGEHWEMDISWMCVGFISYKWLLVFAQCFNHLSEAQADGVDRHTCGPLCWLSYTCLERHLGMKLAALNQCHFCIFLLH